MSFCNLFKRNRTGKGQGLVEFALVLPLLLLVMFAVIEFGRALFTYSAVSSASREAARYGGAAGNSGGYIPYYSDCAGIRAAATRIGGMVGVQDADISISYDHGPGTTVFSSVCPPAEDLKLGDRVRVQVGVVFSPIVPLVNVPPIPINASAARTIIKNVSVEGTPAPIFPANTPVPEADLSIVKNDSADPVNPGEHYDYSITVTNNSSDPAENVVVNDTLQPGMVYVSNSCGMTGAPGPVLTWTIGPLASGASVSCNITVYANESNAEVINIGTVINVASVTSTTKDPDGTNNLDGETTSIRRVDLVVKKSESVDPVIAGSGEGNLEYYVTVSNNGPYPATGIAVSDVTTFPESVTLDAYTLSQGSFSSPTWSVGDLGVNESAILTVTLTAPSYAIPGIDVISNAAVLTHVDQAQVNPGDESDIEFTSIKREVDLIVTKTDSDDPVKAGSGEGNLVYVVNVLNNGPSDASSIILSEVLTVPEDGYTTIDAVTPSLGEFSFSEDSSTQGVWQLGDLAAGESATLEVVLTVGPEADFGEDVIGDTATVASADQELINPADDWATETTSIVRVVDLTISKTESIDPVEAGSGAGNLTYEITVVNNGPVEAHDIEVHENLTYPGGVTLDSATPSLGGFDGTIWSIPVLAVGQSETLTIVLTVDETALYGKDAIADIATIRDAYEYLDKDGDDSVREATTIDGDHPPVAVPDSYFTTAGITLDESTIGPLGLGVLENDTDEDGDLLTAELDTGPSFGTLALKENGAFSYTPAAGFCGTDSFTYHANDGLADSNIAIVTIQVLCTAEPTSIGPEFDRLEPVTLTASYTGSLDGDETGRFGLLSVAYHATPVQFNYYPERIIW